MTFSPNAGKVAFGFVADTIAIISGNVKSSTHEVAYDFPNRAVDSVLDRLPVEPETLSALGPGPLSLDEFTKLTILSGFDQNVGGTPLVDIEWSRDAGSTWVTQPKTSGLILGVTNTTGMNGAVHIITNPFEADFMKDSAAAVDVDDFLDFRISITGTSAGTQPCGFGFMLEAGSGGGNSIIKPHRGSVFSAPQYQG